MKQGREAPKTSIYMEYKNINTSKCKYICPCVPSRDERECRNFICTCVSTPVVPGNHGRRYLWHDYMIQRTFLPLGHTYGQVVLGVGSVSADSGHYLSHSTKTRPNRKISLLKDAVKPRVANQVCAFAQDHASFMHVDDTCFQHVLWAQHP